MWICLGALSLQCRQHILGTQMSCCCCWHSWSIHDHIFTGSTGTVWTGANGLVCRLSAVLPRWCRLSILRPFWTLFCEITTLPSRRVYFPDLPERLGSAAAVVMRQTQAVNQPEPSRLSTSGENIEQMSWTRQQTVCLVVFCQLNHGGNIKGCNGLRRSFLHTYQSFIMRPWATRLPNLWRAGRLRVWRFILYNRSGGFRSLEIKCQFVFLWQLQRFIPSKLGMCYLSSMQRKNPVLK